MMRVGDREHKGFAVLVPAFLQAIREEKRRKMEVVACRRRYHDLTVVIWGHCAWPSISYYDIGVGWLQEACQTQGGGEGGEVTSGGGDGGK